MLTTPGISNPEQIIARIDTIIRELEDLRQQLAPARPSLVEAQALVRELRGKYATGQSLTQALLDERRQEREREEAKLRRHAPNA